MSDYNILSQPVTLPASSKPARRPKPGSVISVDHEGLKFLVKGAHYKGVPEGSHSPAEPASFEVEQIWLGDFEMSQWLSENAPKVIPEIERRLA